MKEKDHQRAASMNHVHGLCCGRGYFYGRVVVLFVVVVVMGMLNK